MLHTIVLGFLIMALMHSFGDALNKKQEIERDKSKELEDKNKELLFIHNNSKYYTHTYSNIMYLFSNYDDIKEIKRLQIEIEHWKKAEKEHYKENNSNDLMMLALTQKDYKNELEDLIKTKGKLLTELNY